MTTFPTKHGEVRSIPHQTSSHHFLTQKILLSNKELFTVGVEEAYQIIDPETRELCSRSRQILPIAQDYTDGAAV